MGNPESHRLAKGHTSGWRAGVAKKPGVDRRGRVGGIGALRGVSCGFRLTLELRETRLGLLQGLATRGFGGDYVG